MLEAGWIEVVGEPAERRRKVYRLTPGGQAELAAELERLDEIVRFARSNTSSPSRDRALERLVSGRTPAPVPRQVPAPARRRDPPRCGRRAPTLPDATGTCCALVRDHDRSPAIGAPRPRAVSPPTPQVSPYRRRRWSRNDGLRSTGPAPRGPSALGHPGHLAGHRAHAGPRHRHEHVDLQRRQRRVAAPFEYYEPDRLVHIGADYPSDGVYDSNHSGGIFRRIQASSDTLVEVAAVRNIQQNLSGVPTPVQAQVAGCPTTPSRCSA